MKRLYKMGLASVIFMVLTVLILPPVWKSIYFREGTVAVKYYIFDEDNDPHFIITLYNSDYEKPGTDFMSQDFKMLEYEVDYKTYSSANRSEIFKVPSRFKLARLEELVSPKHLE